MYEHFYGLRERPFDLTTDPRFLYLTAKHREALYTLRYGISGRKGVTMLTGEAGTGKTTLLHRALAEERRDNRSIVCITNPTLTRPEFFELLTDRFGMTSDAARSKSRFLMEFERSLIERQEANGLSALIVDEAQGLPDDLLEEVRLLANLETSTDKLLSVILVGQPDLARRLNDPSLKQLKQRVALRSRLDPLDLQDTASYIAARIRAAGGSSAGLFTREAVIAVYEHSGGIPRTISVICDNALITGFAADQKPVGAALVREACLDLELEPVARVTLPPVDGRPGSAASVEPGPGSSPSPPSEDDGGPHPSPSPRDRARRRDATPRRTESETTAPEVAVGDRRGWRGFTSFQ